MFGPMRRGSAPGESRKRSATATREYLEPHREKALDVLIAMLEDYDPKRRFDAAREILDRVQGKPTASLEVTGSDGGPIAIQAEQLWHLNPHQLATLRAMLDQHKTQQTIDAELVEAQPLLPGIDVT